ncbi:MAG TPA: hypothetical protein DER09_12695 [Prolixibacteraceae bacterium]|nr:hypothetical protein [Prolixibacteraceae bacterium]
MKIRIKISKKQWLNIAIFAAVIAVAAVFDVYFENRGVQVAGIETSASDNENEKSSVQLFSQSVDFGVKIQVLKTVQRKIQLKTHDKFLQQFHQLRNYQVLKAEVQTQNAPQIITYQYLSFRNYIYFSPDDIPSVA